MSENIKPTVEELRKLIKIDNVIGTPIETDDKILIPVMRLGVGFGVGNNVFGKQGSEASGAGAGLEPVSMIMIPKKENTSEGVRVLDLTKGSNANKALSDLSLVVSDIIKNYMDIGPDDHDESEYIEPAFSTKEIETDEE